MGMKPKSNKNGTDKKQKKTDTICEDKIKKLIQKNSIEELSKNNVEYIKDLLGNPNDLVHRTFDISGKKKSASVLYIDELADKALIQDNIISPIVLGSKDKDIKDSDLWGFIANDILTTGQTTEIDKMEDAVKAILSGSTVLFIDGFKKAITVGTQGWQIKSIGEPKSETNIRGSHEALNETGSVSLSMIRRRLKDPMLRIKTLTLGERTNTSVYLLYIDDVADKKLVNTVKKRVSKIKVDGILETSYIQENIHDNKWSPFPQVQDTERPDTVVGHLLEGKVAIIVDGSPQALIAPSVFTQFFNASDDYYDNFYMATFLRILRYVCVAMALLLPGLYIAFSAFHPELIPAKLMSAMAEGRASVPFNVTTEVFLMELSIEVIREASIRIPGFIGSTIGIVGALIVGQSAVQAGLVSPAVVIITGLTAVSAYTVPSYTMFYSFRLLRFFVMISASMFGLFGIVLASLLILIHLADLSSFGVSYLSPISPLRITDLKDTIFRGPWNLIKKRPQSFNPKNTDRRRDNG